MLYLLTVHWLASFFVFWNVFHSDCCKFPNHWVGNWYQSGIRKTISIEGSRFSSKGSCVAADGDKFLIANEEHTCYRCVVIHEKHYNVLQYKETFCHGHETLIKICALITGEALLYSMFREDAIPITCPFKPPYTFTYNRGHGECRYPVSTIDSCTQDSRIVIQYQACPDVYGSESALEEIQCLAVWKEGSYRYLVGKVGNYRNAAGEDHYRCFVFEKSTSSSLASDSDSTADSDVEYRIAQSGDATCTGLFSPAEGSRTMILKRTPHNYKCKFPLWMTKKKQWHTLDYSHSYMFLQNNSTLRIANTSSTNGDYSHSANDRGAGNHGLFHSGEELLIMCIDTLKSSDDYTQLLTHYLTDCAKGFLCVAFYRRSDHIGEIQIGAPTKRQEDACQRSHFDVNKISLITLVTPEPETKVCPFSGNFRVNGVSGMEQSVSEKLATEESTDQRPYLSSVDIMGTYSDALSQTTVFKSDNQIKIYDSESDVNNDYIINNNNKDERKMYEMTYSVQADDHRSDHSRIFKREVSYVDFQSNARLNLSNSYVLLAAKETTRGGDKYKMSYLATEGNTPHLERPYKLNETRSRADPLPVYRTKRNGAGNHEKKNSCILNFNKLYFGCRSPDTMEFRSDCPVFSSDIISVYLCHGSWMYNISQNSSVHYLITTPLSRTSRGQRRYCFMYQMNEQSSIIHFTSTSDTCHRAAAPIVSNQDGVLSFNITPIEGKCSEMNSSSVMNKLSYKVVIIAIILHFYIAKVYHYQNSR